MTLKKILVLSVSSPLNKNHSNINIPAFVEMIFRIFWWIIDFLAGNKILDTYNKYLATNNQSNLVLQLVVFSNSAETLS